MKAIFVGFAIALSLTGCTQVASEETQSVEFYFVGDSPTGFRLFSELRELTTETKDLANLAVGQLVSGEISPLDPDYANLWDESTSLNDVTISGSDAIVDIDLGTLNVGGEAEARAIDQIVWTLTGINPEIERVSFQVNGETVESFAGHVDTTGVFSRSGQNDVLSSVQITSILEGQEVDNPVLIFGQACVFEGNVSWTLKQNGTEIKSGSVTADGACPDRSNWELNIGELSSGSYLLEVFESSAKDGSVVAMDTKSLVVK